jgi:hypothetical protein
LRWRKKLISTKVGTILISRALTPANRWPITHRPSGGFCFSGCYSPKKLHEWRHESRIAPACPKLADSSRALTETQVSRRGEFLNKMVYVARMRRRNSFIKADFGNTARELLALKM